MAEDRFLTGHEGFLGADASLLRELQHTLFVISCQSELGDESSLDSINQIARSSLGLLDSFLLASQVESGQVALALAPFGPGAIMHDAAHELRPANGQQMVEVVSGVHQPVMTNSLFLKNLFVSAGTAVMDVAKPKSLICRSFVTKSGKVGVGVFARDFTVSPKELRDALSGSSNRHMPLAGHSEKTGVMLTLADRLARVLGGELHVKKMGNYSGLATHLPLSKQLSLV